jgi:hypothetical protein
MTKAPKIDWPRTIESLVIFILATALGAWGMWFIFGRLGAGAVLICASVLLILGRIMGRGETA